MERILRRGDNSNAPARRRLAATTLLAVALLLTGCTTGGNASPPRDGAASSVPSGTADAPAVSDAQWAAIGQGISDSEGDLAAAQQDSAHNEQGDASP